MVVDPVQWCEHANYVLYSLFMYFVICIPVIYFGNWSGSRSDGIDLACHVSLTNYVQLTVYLFF